MVYQSLPVLKDKSMESEQSNLSIKVNKGYAELTVVILDELKATTKVQLDLTRPGTGVETILVESFRSNRSPESETQLATSVSKGSFAGHDKQEIPPKHLETQENFEANPAVKAGRFHSANPRMFLVNTPDEELGRRIVERRGAGRRDGIHVHKHLIFLFSFFLISCPALYFTFANASEDCQIMGTAGGSNVFLRAPFGGMTSCQGNGRTKILEDLSLECCPSVLELIEPIGAVNQQGMYVILYRTEHHTQRFHEVSCRTGISGEPCRFIKKKLLPFSKCVQTYSYTASLVIKPNGLDDYNSSSFNYLKLGETEWKYDLVRVRSGCSCTIEAKAWRHKRKWSKYQDFMNFRRP